MSKFFIQIIQNDIYTFVLSFEIEFFEIQPKILCELFYLFVRYLILQNEIGEHGYELDLD